MKTLLIGVGAAASIAMGTGAWMGLVRGSTGAYAGSSVHPSPTLSLQQPSTHARMTSAAVIRAADKYLAQIPASHGPITTSYGSLDVRLGPKVGPRTGAGFQPIGRTNVWLVHVSGFTMQRPVAGSQRPGAPEAPPLHSLTVVVQDSTGTALEAELSS